MKTQTKISSAALTIAGSDSCAGAGLQADLKTFQAFASYGASVVTAVTAQNTLTVSASQSLSTKMIVAQLQAVFLDLPITAVKTGMLADALSVIAVADFLSNLAIRVPLILDPVLIATTGVALAAADTTRALSQYLIPCAELVTPNLAEVEALTGVKATDKTTMLLAAGKLQEQGCPAVLLKGGHLSATNNNHISDLLLVPSGPTWFEHARVEGQFHGTGCTLSAAICAQRAQGVALREAVSHAIAYVQSCIEQAKLPLKGEVALLSPPIG